MSSVAQDDTSATLGSAALLDGARAAVVAARAGRQNVALTQIRLSHADYLVVNAIKARERARGIPATLMGLYTVEDPSLRPGDFLVV